MGSQARVFHHQLTHFVRGQVGFNTAGVAGGIRIGILPSGARILRTHVIVEAAFNAATTNVLTVGNRSVADAYVNAGAVNEGATGLTTVPPPGVTSVCTADTEILVAFAQTGTAATTGVATVIVEYVPNL